MVAAGELLTRRRVVLTRPRVLWASGWLLIAGGLLWSAWWLNQRSAVLAADVYERQQLLWGLSDWVWHVAGAGMIGAAVLGVFHMLPHLVRGRTAAGVEPGKRGSIDPVIRMDLKRIAYALAVLGFVAGACHWFRLTALLVVITAVWTVAVGVFRRADEPLGRGR